MRSLGIAILVLVALLTGGCSAAFLFASLLDPNPGATLQYVGVPALMGLAVCAGCILIIRALMRPPPPSAAKPQDPARKDRW